VRRRIVDQFYVSVFTMAGRDRIRQSQFAPSRTSNDKRGYIPSKLRHSFCFNACKACPVFFVRWLEILLGRRAVAGRPLRCGSAPVLAGAIRFTFMLEHDGSAFSAQLLHHPL